MSDADRPEPTDIDHATNICTDVDRTQESSEDVLGFVGAPSQR